MRSWNSSHGAQPANEAQEFYATPEIVEAAKEVLHRNRSTVGLKVLETKVVIDANGKQQTLSRVVPILRSAAPDVCRDFAENVHGGVPDAMLFRDEHGATAIAGVRTGDLVEITGAFHLAEGLAGIVEQGDANALTPSRASDFVARDFFGTATNIEGVGLPEIAEETVRRHRDQSTSCIRTSVRARRRAWGSSGRAGPALRGVGDGCPGVVVACGRRLSGS